MNIYEERLNLSYQLLEFTKEIIKEKKKWLAYDIEHNRDGVPQRLWYLREKLNLTESEFAKSIGIKEKDYVKYEKIGEKVPQEVIDKVAKIYKIPKKWLEVKEDFSLIWDE